MNLIVKGPIKVVGLELTASWKDLWIQMPVVWQEFYSRQSELKSCLSDQFMDVCLGKTGTMYRQLVCGEVDSLELVPEGMTPLEIPEQKYIQMIHRGPLPEIAKSFGKMYDWAKRNALKVDEFKIDMGYTRDGGELEHELLVRVGE